MDVDGVRMELSGCAGIEVKSSCDCYFLPEGTYD
jgi:hypothetical protein